MNSPSTDAGAPVAVWRVAGASVAGTAHERACVGCQDAHRWAALPNGCLVIAVADGAGSAARAAEGAQIVVAAAEAYLVSALRDAIPDDERGWREAMRRTFAAALGAVTAHAAGAGQPLRDYAATLTVVAAVVDTLVAGQVGDGIAVAEGDEGLFLAAAPQRGEFANEVTLLTSEQAAEGAAIAVIPTVLRAVAVTTDGLLRLAVQLPSHAPHAPFFRPLFAFLREATDLSGTGDELARFLASERVSDRTDDDKTLVLAVRAVPSESDETPTTAPAEESQAG